MHGMTQARTSKQRPNQTPVASSGDIFLPSESSEVILIPRPGSSKVSSLETVVHNQRQKYGLTSLACANVDGDSVEVGVAGKLHSKSDVDVTQDSKYHLGSCTKMMTSALMARLVEKGKLKWSTTVSQAFPGFASSMDPQLKDVSLEMLLTHKAGMVPELRFLDFSLVKRAFEHDLSRRELAKAALEKPPQHPPGQKFEYSNIGYTIAGAMAEAATGMSWEELMKREIFEPLGMKSAGFGPAGEEEPWGHTAKREPVNPSWETFWKEGKLPPDNPPVLGPAGTVHSNMEDWAKFIQAQGRRDESFLSKESWEYLQSPRPGDTYTPGGWLTGADGHFKTEAGDLYHNGSNTMFYSFVRLRPGDGLNGPKAVLVATNQNSAQPGHELADELLA